MDASIQALELEYTILSPEFFHCWPTKCTTTLLSNKDGLVLLSLDKDVSVCYSLMETEESQIRQENGTPELWPKQERTVLSSAKPHIYEENQQVPLKTDILKIRKHYICLNITNSPITCTTPKNTLNCYELHKFESKFKG